MGAKTSVKASRARKFTGEAADVPAQPAAPDFTEPFDFSLNVELPSRSRPELPVQPLPPSLAALLERTASTRPDEAEPSQPPARRRRHRFFRARKVRPSEPN